MEGPYYSIKILLSLPSLSCKQVTNIHGLRILFNVDTVQKLDRSIVTITRLVWSVILVYDVLLAYQVYQRLPDRIKLSSISMSR